MLAPSCRDVIIACVQRTWSSQLEVCPEGGQKLPTSHQHPASLLRCAARRVEAKASDSVGLRLQDGARGLTKSDENRRYRNKGGRKFRANLRKLGKHNRFTPSFITNKFGKFRANPVNFAQIRPILFLSTCFGVTPPFITPPFVRFQGERGGGGLLLGGVQRRGPPRARGRGPGHRGKFHAPKI